MGVAVFMADNASLAHFVSPFWHSIDKEPTTFFTSIEEMGTSVLETRVALKFAQ